MRTTRTRTRTTTRIGVKMRKRTDGDEVKEKEVNKNDVREKLRKKKCTTARYTNPRNMYFHGSGRPLSPGSGSPG